MAASSSAAPASPAAPAAAQVSGGAPQLLPLFVVLPLRLLLLLLLLRLQRRTDVKQMQVLRLYLQIDDVFTDLFKVKNQSYTNKPSLHFL